MACDLRYLFQGQTAAQRADQVKEAVGRLSDGLASGRVRAKVGPQGAIAFEGFSEQDRAGVSDACAYRRIMVEGSALARAAIARAEQIAGRGVDRQVVGRGVHSHDGGHSWHSGHKR